MRTRPLFLTLLAFLALAAMAFGLRSLGIWDPASVLTGQQKAVPAVAAGGASKAGGAGGAAPAGARPGGAGQRPPAPVEVAKAETRSLTDSISAIGSLVALETAEVAADSAGRIISVSAVDGASVKKGDELFQLDGALLAAELQDTEARLALAQTTFRRAQTLARSQTVAQSQVDQTRAELEQAQSAAELVRERQRRLVVRAPFDGTLGFRLVSEGAYVTAGTPLVRLDHIAKLKVSLSIPERYYTFIKAGQEVTVTAEAVPGKTFRAAVSAINPVVDVNGRALQIQATLDNPDLLLRPGMLVKADIIGATREAVTVPEAAVVPQGQDATVFEVKDDVVHRVVITTGTRRDGWVEVATGLQAGAVVVTAGAIRLNEGAKIKITQTQATQ